MTCSSPTPSGFYGPLHSATTNGDAVVYYHRPGSPAPVVPTPGHVGFWNFPEFGSGGSPDFAGDCALNTARVMVVGDGTLEVHTASYGVSRNLSAGLYHDDPVLGNVLDSSQTGVVGDTFTFDVSTHGETHCVHWVDVTETGPACGSKWGFAGADWDHTGPPEPPPPPSVDFDVYTPDGIFVVSLTDLLEKRIRVELNADGSGHFVIHRSNPAATEANLQKGNIVRVTFTEIDPDPIWEFLIEEGDFALLSSDEDGGEELSFGGPGTLSVLRNAIVHPIPQDHPTDPDPPEPWQRQAGVVLWYDQEAGNILRRLIQEAEVRGVLGPGTYDITKTFTNTQDTNGTTWEQMGSWTAPIGSNLYDEAMRLVAAGQLGIEMAVGLVLNAYQVIGRDLTGTDFGEGVVRFVKGVNIADELRRALPGGEFVSHAIVQGTSGAYAYDEVSSYPYVREKFATVNSDAAAVMAEAAEALLGAHAASQEPLLFAHRTPWPGDGPDDDAGIYLPGPEGSANGRYWVGDLVTAHTGEAEFDYTNATHRVYAITLYEDETGYLAPPIVELNAPFPAEDGRDSSLPTATAITSGGSSGGGSGSTPHVHVLGSLSDVSTVGDYAPSDGDGLVYDAGLGRWIPGTVGGTITVEEDGDTPVADVDHIVFDGATVTDDGGGQVTVTITPGGAHDHDAEYAPIGHTHGGGGGPSGAIYLIEPAADPNADDDEGTGADTDPIAGWTTLGTVTTLDRDTTFPGAFYLEVPANANTRVDGLYKSHTLAAGEAFVARIDGDTVRANFNRVGIFIGVSSPGRIDTMAIVTATPQAEVLAMTNPTSLSGTVSASNISRPSPLYLAIRCNSSTSYDYLWGRPSPLGIIWTTQVAARNPSMTQAICGLFANAQNGSTAVKAVFQWARFYAALPVALAP